jgi:hypothetical protein
MAHTVGLQRAQVLSFEIWNQRNVKGKHQHPPTLLGVSLNGTELTAKIIFYSALANVSASRPPEN